MFDGIKIKDVSVDVDALLTNDRLTFGTFVDGQTGAILNPIQRAFDRGMTFRLVPRQSSQGYRVEMKGSLHKFYNKGQHNADQFTISDLLLTLDELTTGYGFNPFKSKINGVEFGVNVELPFTVSQVLKNLVCYKNESFYLDTRSDTPYYVCQFQRYAVKIYDKGKQKGLNTNLLRFEIRARKMEYFNGTGIRLRTLADLLNVTNYKLLEALLIDTFNEILFNDPTINLTNLTPDEREIYRNGREARNWQTPDGLTPRQSNAHRQQMSRDRKRYRALLDQYGCQQQKEVAALIGQTWNQLTAVDDKLLTRIDHYRATWQNLTNPDLSGDSLEPTTITPNPSLTGGACHKLTDFDSPVTPGASATTCHKLTNLANLNLSQINPLYSPLDCDSHQPAKDRLESHDQPQKPGAVVCPITGIIIERPRPRQRFASAASLRTLYYADRPMFDRVAAQFLTEKQSRANLDQQCYYIAHNIRNAYANPFNSPLRRIKKYKTDKDGQTQLFPISQTIKVTDQIQAGIDYRKGTGHEIIL